jgi:hypothetical protein
LLLAVVAIAALLAVAIGQVGAALVDHQRARTAADAAALAGAVGGRADAARVAAANGARVLGFLREGDVVTVRVAVGEATASARATSGPPEPATP